MATNLIIGGGITGLCTAYYLNAKGMDVTVIDRGNITDGCSFGNMGYMSPSHFVPLASPGIIAEGLKYIISSKSPFYIKPRMDAGLIQWALKFMKNSNAQKAKAAAPHLNNILQLSRQLINDINNNLQGGFDMEEKGCFMLCKSAKALAHELELADEAEQFGLQVQRLDAAGVQALEPNVQLDVAGAVLFKDDCHFDPGKLMIKLKQYLQANAVKFALEETVTGFEKAEHKVTAAITSKGRIGCENIVIAAGSWIPHLAKMLGIKLLLQPGKGYSYTYPLVEKNILHPAILVDGRCAITPWGSRLRIGGTMELSGINYNIIPQRMKGIYDAVMAFYPGLEIAPPPKQEIWCGLRPVTPDGLAYIGKTTQYENVIVAGGHAMLGISQGPGTGLLVSEILCGEKTSIDITAFSPARK